MHNPDTLELTQELIARASVTPVDGGCQQLMTARLAAAGFSVEKLDFGNVENFWATHGKGGPVLCFAGHTDVVPTGPLEEWRTGPFQPTIVDGRALWTRRCRHEERPGGHGDGCRGLSCASTRTTAARLPS